VLKNPLNMTKGSQNMKENSLEIIKLYSALKADLHIACRAAKGLECVLPI